MLLQINMQNKVSTHRIELELEPVRELELGTGNGTDGDSISNRIRCLSLSEKNMRDIKLSFTDMIPVPGDNAVAGFFLTLETSRQAAAFEFEFG